MKSLCSAYRTPLCILRFIANPQYPRARARAADHQIKQTNYWRLNMANGWTQERRARQAALIRIWKPWECSTGPRTAAGKARSSSNADRPESFNRRLRAIKQEVATLVSQAKEIGQLLK